MHCKRTLLCGETAEQMRWKMAGGWAPPGLTPKGHAQEGAAGEAVFQLRCADPEDTQKADYGHRPSASSPITLIPEHLHLRPPSRMHIRLSGPHPPGRSFCVEHLRLVLPDFYPLSP